MSIASRPLFRAPAALIALALSCSAQAMSYVPMADSSLYDGADAIVSGTVQAIDDTPENSSDATRYQLTVEQVLKGDATLGTLSLRVPGSRDKGRDGALVGVNVEETGAVADAVSIPVIASGGIASVDDIRQLKARKGATIAGAVLGKSLYAGTIQPAEALKVAARR